MLTHLNVCCEEFYFNYPSSIFGELKPSLSSGSHHIPFRHFIVTPLLPCGKVDAKVHKFTGHDDFGDASDNLTKAIHAFVHFTLWVVYSDNYILFCSLKSEFLRFCQRNIPWDWWMSHQSRLSWCSRSDVSVRSTGSHKYQPSGFQAASNLWVSGLNFLYHWHDRNTESLHANCWDGGPKVISHLINQHEAICKDN